MATKAAAGKGMTVGDWLAEAVVAHARSAGAGVSADADGVAADGWANVPAIPLPVELAAAINDIHSRLTKIEAGRQKGVLSRLFGRHN